MKNNSYRHLATLWLGYSVVLLYSTGAMARDLVLPAGTVLQCVLNEPNFSSSTVEVGDPVLCHLRQAVEFGGPVFPRGSYLVGHLESTKEPGHFFGKGNWKLQFDRMGLPIGDFPLNTKVIAVRGYRVDREGKIDGKGHAKRDVAEWTLPPLWPWKVIMLPTRGPRPKLKGETTLSLRLMDDLQIPDVAQTSGQQVGTVRRQSARNPMSGASSAKLLYAAEVVCDVLNELQEAASTRSERTERQSVLNYLCRWSDMLTAATPDAPLIK